MAKVAPITCGAFRRVRSGLGWCIDLAPLIQSYPRQPGFLPFDAGNLGAAALICAALFFLLDRKMGRGYWGCIETEGSYNADNRHI